MNAQNIFPTGDIGPVNENLSVETTTSKQGGIKDFRPVRRGDNNCSAIGTESVHFNEQGVECLFPFVVPSERRDC